MPSRMREKQRISSWKRVWKRAKHWEMPNRMIVKWKFSYLDGSVEEGQALGDAQQDESNVEVFYLDGSVKEGQVLGDAQQDESNLEVSTWMTVWPGIGRCPTG